MNFFQPQQMSYSGFQQTFRCYPITLLERPDLEHGGKIILPPSSLDRMATLNLTYPLLFEMSNHEHQGRKVHGGVLEFVAEEGRVYMPFWMMQNINANPGDFVKVKTVNLPLGTYVKLQPQSKTFLDISNPRVVLEIRLRAYAALGLGETILIEYNKKEHYLTVLEIKPLHPLSKAISIIETDLIVDFAQPADMEEEELSKKSQESSSTTNNNNNNNNNNSSSAAKQTKMLTKGSHSIEDSDSEEESFKPFSGSGYSLKSGGKPASTSTTSTATTSSAMNVPGKKLGGGSATASPASSWSSTSKKMDDDSEEDSEEEEDSSKKKSKFVAFSGSGYTLKGKK